MTRVSTAIPEKKGIRENKEKLGLKVKPAPKGTRARMGPMDLLARRVTWGLRGWLEIQAMLGHLANEGNKVGNRFLIICN